MPHALGQLKETPSQTAGPYVHIGLTPNFLGLAGIYPTDLGHEMVNDRTKGEHIIIEGRVIDGADEPLRDCLVEIWQADAAGLYASPLETRGTPDPAKQTPSKHQANTTHTGAHHVIHSNPRPGA